MQGGYRLSESYSGYNINLPVLSIITVVYNGAQFIERTIKSIQEQTYSNIEHIIVDGNSTDKTLDIIKRYEHKIAYWLSEKDKGIYDAMNKGLNLASGEYILFLNAGDELADRDVVNQIFTLFEPSDVYYGDTIITSVEGKPLRKARLRPPNKLSWRSIRYGMVVCHQSFIVRKSITGTYDLSYHISADIDWVINCLKKSNKVTNTKLDISKFMEGGMSTTNQRKGLIERYYILKTHYGFLPNLLNHGYIVLRRMKQVFFEDKS